MCGVPYWCQDVKLLKAHWHQCSIEAMSYSYLSPETLLPTDLVNHKSISQEPSPVLQKSPCWRSKHVLCKSPCWRSKHCFVSRPVVGEAKNCFTTDYTPSSYACPAQRRRYSKVWHPKEMTPHSRRSQSLKTKQGSNAREKRNHNHKHSKAL